MWIEPWTLLMITTFSLFLISLAVAAPPKSHLFTRIYNFVFFLRLFNYENRIKIVFNAINSWTEIICHGLLQQLYFLICIIDTLFQPKKSIICWAQALLSSVAIADECRKECNPLHWISSESLPFHGAL